MRSVPSGVLYDFALLQTFPKILDTVLLINNKRYAIASKASIRKNMKYIFMSTSFQKQKRPTLIESDGLAFRFRQPGNLFPS
jgi:hypothetical protein